MRAIVFANGELAEPLAAQARPQPGDLIVAADGGARHCQFLGLTPHTVVGDLDSLDPAARATLEGAGARLVVHRPDKDETDLELALLYAAAQGAEAIEVLAALGRRLDMTLANLLLLTHPGLRAVRVTLWHGQERAWLIRPPGADIPGQPGDTLSLLPLGGDAQGITTRGLAYPLRGETLAVGPARGVSNVLTTADARVDLRAGWLLAVLTPGRA